MSVQELVITEMSGLSEASLKSLFDYASFLKFQEERGGNPRQESTLEQMVAAITPENVHAEINSGTPVGNEAW